MKDRTITVSVSGSGGSGAVTIGLVLLKSIANVGFYGYMSRSSGPQIRGGESSVILSFSDHPIERNADGIDLHFALDWRGFERFSDEIALNSDSCVIFDSSHDTLPDMVAKIGANIIEVNLKEQVKQIKESLPNSFAIGILAAQIGLPLESVFKALQQTLHQKDEAFIKDTIRAIEAGYTLLEESPSLISDWQPSSQSRWNISGNEACGLGALRGGIRLVAAYPITPASDIVEYLAPRLEKVGGTVLIAEDELAAMNMVIGGSFGGKASMTATSGPGVSLMTEAMGLAVASETPALVVNVMRGGPSTGIPTKSEQSDLNQALFGMHGEAPHIVVAPLSIADTVSATQWAVGLAEAMQTLVILLSNQRLGQSRAIVDAVPAKTYELQRKVLAEESAEPYERYAVTEDSISPMAIPGNKQGLYTAEGLEHTDAGKPSSMASDHLQQLRKRESKVAQFDYKDEWAEILTSGKRSRAIVLTWGSTFGSVKESVMELNREGMAIDLLALRLLMPLRVDAIKELCEDKQVIVVEQSYSGQFYHYCLGQGAIGASSLSLAEAGPLMLKKSDIKHFIKEALL